jgi:hypothetical protein
MLKKHVKVVALGMYTATIEKSQETWAKERVVGAQ